MNNTMTVTVKKSDGWKPVITGGAGAFTASRACIYFISNSLPTGVVGHRLNTGDLELFTLHVDESLYVMTNEDVDVIISSSGIGFESEWLRLKSIGLKAETIQSYVEVNCKTSSQWGLTTYEPALEKTTGVRYLVLVTGDKPVALKARTYSLDGLGIQVTTYREPTLTGSTDITATNVHNMNDRNPETLLAQLRSATTAQVTDKGVMWIPTRTFIGDAQTGSKNRTTIDPDFTGLETWFAENSTYLIETKTIDGNDVQRVSLFATFYEGTPDLP